MLPQGCSLLPAVGGEVGVLLVFKSNVVEAWQTPTCLVSVCQS